MKILSRSKIPFAITVCSALLTVFNSSPIQAHGLVEYPPSRQQFCGVLTKPHETSNTDALYPECAGAFEGYVSGGYSYMSVLTHARGRLRPLPDLAAGETAPANESDGVTPDLASNVCGYDAETFDNGATPWDTSIDWPTSNISAGQNLFLWNIQWGPHFDDTQEFHYWITKEEFVFEVGKALTWDDFEEQPFCQLDFDRDDFTANPDIVADTDNAKFYTYCDVPERTGQHVIYAEWGRNYFTWERFHGCIDVEFNDTGETIVQANITATPQGELTGSGTIELSAADSTGDDLTYQWSINDQSSDASYTLTTPTAENTTLTFTDPTLSGDVMIYLTVTSGDQQSTQTLTLQHQAQNVTSDWQYLQALTEPLTLSTGDTVQVRVVLDSGEDIYLPSTALEITDALAGDSAWTLALATAVNELDSHIAIGILDAESDLVEPIISSSDNLIYSKATSAVASVFLNIDEADPGEGNATDVQCYYEVNSSWSGGFSGKVVIENNSDQAINGWEVSWSYSDGSTISNSWNTSLSGNYTATNLSWNATIAAGSSVEFGFSGVSTSATAEVPEVTGEICDTSEN